MEELEKKAPVGKNAVVETYAGDMAEVLQNDKEGLIKKVIHGAEEKEEEKRISPESKKNRVLAFMSILLLVLGAGTLFFFLSSKGPKAVPIEEQFTPIIFNDKISYIETFGLRKEEIENSILNEINSIDVKEKGVEGIYPTQNKNIVGLREFISLLKWRFALTPEEVMVSNNFLLGGVNIKDGEKHPGFFLLIKTRSMADIFDDLRNWESKMFLDLRGLLGLDPGGDNAYLLSKTFEDGLVENKNARFLYDKDKKLVLLYVFADDNSVVVSNSEDAVREIFTRLASKETGE